MQKLGGEDCELESLEFETEVEDEDLSPEDQENENKPQIDIERAPMQGVLEEGCLEVISSHGSSQRGKQKHGSKEFKASGVFLLKFV